VPPEFAPITAHLVVPRFPDAVTFYKTVFGAEERQVNPGPDGKVWHAEVVISGVRVLLMESFEDMGLVAREPQPTARGRDQDHVMLNVIVENVDETFQRAVGAGSVGMIEPHDAFWGDRYAEFRGPDGHRWALSKRLEQLSPDEQQRRADEFRAQAGNARSPAPALRRQGVRVKAPNGE
jgi:uncharacterized glyoxalase superfamily protein PhnB